MPSYLSFLVQNSSHANLMEKLPLGLGDHFTQSLPPRGLNPMLSLTFMRSLELVTGQFHCPFSIMSPTFAFFLRPELSMIRSPYLLWRRPNGVSIHATRKYQYHLQWESLFYISFFLWVSLVSSIAKVFNLPFWSPISSSFIAGSFLPNWPKWWSYLVVQDSTNVLKLPPCSILY